MVLHAIVDLYQNCPNYTPGAIDIWYVALPSDTLPSLFILCPCGQKIVQPLSQIFYIGIYRENKNSSC